jgi:NAD(P)-dependent dehydrogenase (short-subunit alcohol dehydrogenase family)
MAGELAGTAALVTGGGTGIGHACAVALAADGAAVTICGRTEAKLLDSAERANSRAGHGGQVRHVVADVTDEDAVVALMESAAQPTGTLGVVIANHFLSGIDGFVSARLRAVSSVTAGATLRLQTDQIEHRLGLVLRVRL